MLNKTTYFTLLLMYSVWFVRVYRAKDGGWELVSHRTVAEFAA